MDAEKLENSMKSSNEKVIMKMNKMDNFYSMESNASIEGAELCTMDRVTLIHHNSTFIVGINMFIDMYPYKCAGTIYTFQFDRGPVRQV